MRNCSLQYLFLRFVTFSGNKNGTKLIETRNLNLHFWNVLVRELSILERSCLWNQKKCLMVDAF